MRALTGGPMAAEAALGKQVTIRNRDVDAEWTGELVGIQNHPSYLVKVDGKVVSLPQHFELTVQGPGQ